MSKNLIWLNVGGEKFCARKRLEKSIIWYHEKHKNYFRCQYWIFPHFHGKRQVRNTNKLETSLIS